MRTMRTMLHMPQKRFKNVLPLGLSIFVFIFRTYDICRWPAGGQLPTPQQQVQEHGFVLSPAAIIILNGTKRARDAVVATLDFLHLTS